MTALVIWKYYSPSAELNEEWLYETSPSPKAAENSGA